jgi:hypothetical protein
LYPVFIRVGFERLEVAKHPITEHQDTRMNTHKHARLTFARRFEMVNQMLSGATARKCSVHRTSCHCPGKPWRLCASCIR